MGGSRERGGEPPTDRLSVLSVAVGALVVLPLVYVLSIGPVAKTFDLLKVDPGPAKAFYAPVIWLHDHTPLRKPLEGYLALWGVK